MIEADQIHQGLWQGSKPPKGSTVSEAGFSLLVLCAMEYQPPAQNFQNVTVVHAPNDDNSYVVPTKQQLNLAWTAAQKAAEEIQAGRSVLVTCYAGLNRSGLVSALTLHRLLGVSGLEACEIVKHSRPQALSNSQFVKCLARIPKRQATNPLPASAPKGFVLL
jgi:protein-tyrosine phosphatase